MFGTGVQFFRNAMVESVERFGLVIRLRMGDQSYSPAGDTDRCKVTFDALLTGLQMHAAA